MEYDEKERGQTELKEERKQSNREKYFRRLRSFNEKGKEVKKQVNEKEG